MEQAIVVGIDGGVQLLSLVTELDHGFIDRNVIRISTICGPIGLPHPVMNGGSTAFGT